jgi:hypothetical protein
MLVDIAPLLRDGEGMSGATGGRVFRAVRAVGRAVEVAVGVFLAVLKPLVQFAAPPLPPQAPPQDPREYRP